jgi:uncharacterized membrane protein YqgA involved in biofilm formation
MPIGTGTVLNVLAVLLGGAIGATIGSRFPERVRLVVTSGLGLVTLVVAGLNAAVVTEAELTDVTGGGGAVLVVLAAVVVGGIVGAWVDVEGRLASVGDRLRARLTRGDEAQPRFVEGFVTASLLFCVGPLTILGSLSDGLGNGIEQLALKSVLDGFAALALAAALGWGVTASAATVLVVQGSLTILGALVGDVISSAAVAAMTATGGVLLLGVGLRLLGVARLPVADLLPALVVAPVIVAIMETTG